MCTDHEMICEEDWACLARCWGLLGVTGTTASLFVGATDCLLQHADWKYHTFRVVWSEWGHCVNAFLMRSSSLSLITKSWACESVSLLAGIIFWSMDSRADREVARSAASHQTIKCNCQFSSEASLLCFSVFKIYVIWQSNTTSYRIIYISKLYLEGNDNYMSSLVILSGEYINILSTKDCSILSISFYFTTLCNFTSNFIFFFNSLLTVYLNILIS